MKLQHIILALTLLIFSTTISSANTGTEDLIVVTTKLYNITGTVMSDMKFIASLPESKQLLYLYSKARLDQAVQLFDTIVTIRNIYDQSSGCKSNIAKTVVASSLISKTRVEIMLRQLTDLEKKLKEANLPILHKIICDAIQATEEGLATVTVLTRFMNNK